MSAVDNALMISVFLVCVAVGMIFVEEINTRYEAETGRKFIEYEMTPFINYTELSVVGTNTAEINATANSMGEFNKPQDVGFDFWFFQSLNVFRLLTNLFIYSIFGVPALLTVLGLPAFLVPGITVIMGISFVLLMAYLVLNKFG